MKATPTTWRPCSHCRRSYDATAAHHNEKASACPQATRCTVVRPDQGAGEWECGLMVVGVRPAEMAGQVGMWGEA